MKPKIKVLSLFDGMSCGQMALERAGFKIEKYYASEIDKHAIKVTQANYPATIQIGDVTKIDLSNLKDIDFLIGGSPCTNFSFAGKQEGMATECNEQITTLERYLELKKAGFKFKGQSYLFWEYVNALKEIKPKYFLLENVLMVKKWKDILTNALEQVYPGEVFCYQINSALVSAQNRKRLYWTNIKGVLMPEDEGVVLKDIVEDGFADTDKSYCIDAHYFKGGGLEGIF